MGVLRDNAEMLMSVLQTFVHDPLIEWSSSNREEKDGSKVSPAVKAMTDIVLKLKGQKEKDTLPLSVHGQVHQLIQEATSELRLGQMYIGWMAWL